MCEKCERTLWKLHQTIIFGYFEIVCSMWFFCSHFFCVASNEIWCEYSSRYLPNEIIRISYFHLVWLSLLCRLTSEWFIGSLSENNWNKCFIIGILCIGTTSKSLHTKRIMCISYTHSVVSASFLCVLQNVRAFVYNIVTLMFMWFLSKQATFGECARCDEGSMHRYFFFNGAAHNIHHITANNNNNDNQHFAMKIKTNKKFTLAHREHRLSSTIRQNCAMWE